MKVVLCLIAIFGGLLERKRRELEKVWLQGGVVASARAREHVL
jgi:hypothetical protein